jgi:hypothetical protein
MIYGKDIYYFKKKLFYPIIPNFGDDLNGELFKKIFGIDFIYTVNITEADFIAIGSSLNGFIQRKFRKSKKDWINQKLHHYKSKVTVLGTGFWDLPEYENFNFCCDMDFKFVRGKLTEKILLDGKKITCRLPVGDLGLLATYIYPNNSNKKYKLGVVSHLDDLDSPIMFDIYKKYKHDCIYINVKEAPEKVIGQIQMCENIVSTSLHGLIISDSFGIPNLWLENKFKRINKPIFKYYDYYSGFDITDIQPMQAIDFLNKDIEIINRLYRIDKNTIEEKQKELFDFCNEYLKKIKNDSSRKNST